MEKILERVLDIVGSWNTGQQMIGLIFFLIVAMFATIKDFRVLMIDMFRVATERNGDPKNHPFFLQKEILLSQIEKIDFSDSERNWLFRTLLQKKVETTYRLIKDYIDNVEWKKLKKVALQAQLLILIDSIPKQYEQEIRSAYLMRYGMRGNNIFNLVYFGDEGFFQYHIKNIELIQHNIRKIMVIEGFDNSEILNSFLLQVWIALDVAIADCVITFHNLNGNLSSLLEGVETSS